MSAVNVERLQNSLIIKVPGMAMAIRFDVTFNSEILLQEK
jgi:hypothetical protein